MPELTLQHIDQITRDIRKQEITFSHLFEELTDHICCDVEYEMQQGLCFADAYRKVKKKMGPRRLKEIQKETLYAVDTKYRYMKNTMKISGITGTILLGFSAIFKINHWPGAAIMMVLGAFALAFVFLPSALGVLWKETHSRKRLFLFISAFFTGFFAIAGIVFKTQHWPGSGVVLSLAVLSAILFFVPSLLVDRFRDQEKRSKRIIYVLGALVIICNLLGLLFKIQHWPLAGLFFNSTFLLFIIVFPWYTWHTWKNENNVSARFIYLVVGSLAIIVPSAMVNLNLQRSYDTGYYLHQRQQQALYNYEFRTNQLFLDQHNDSIVSRALRQVNSKTKALLLVINNIESKMIAESERVPVINSSDIKQTDFGPEIQFSFLTNPFSPQPYRDFMLPERNTRKELDSAMKDYLGYVSGLLSGRGLHGFEKLLDLSVYLPLTNPDGNKVSLMSCLHSLALLKNSILASESYVFSVVSKHQ
jgi:hypothetical protein